MILDSAIARTRATDGALLLLMVAGCETTTQDNAVGGDRKQLLLVSSQQLGQVAAQSYSKLQADSAKTAPASNSRMLAPEFARRGILIEIIPIFARRPARGATPADGRAG